MKLQIALEFMVIFVFVIAMFILVFTIISNQRISLLSRQSFSQLQLIAQGIVQQINTAVEAGNGYTSTTPLQGSLGLYLYNITITKNGIVVVSAKVGQQTIQAIAYSEARSILAPSTLNTTSISVQNSLGQICIDQQCPRADSQSSGIALSSQTTHAALFNGQNTYVNLQYSRILNSGSQYTLASWIRTSSNSTETIFSSFSGSNGYQLYLQQGNAILSSPGRLIASSKPISDGNWHQVVAIAGQNYGAVYLDGNLLSSSSIPANINNNGNSQIGAQCSVTCSLFFNGSISNVQMYGAALTSSQINNLYQEGISGAPLNANTVGWWQLNGNANDYSGGNLTGTVSGAVLFPAVAELFARITNSTGSPLPNLLVGFTATLGNFSKAGSTGSYTNTNGIAIAFLNQVGNSGSASVRALAFNGNLSAQNALAGWWPLNPGQGNSAYDISGNGNRGIAHNAMWSNSSVGTNSTSILVGSFNGKSSYVSTGTAGLPTGSSPRSAFAWVYFNGSTTSNCYLVYGYGTASQYEESQITICNGNAGFAGSTDDFSSSFKVPPNSWHFIGYVYPGNNTVTVYLDGLYQTGSITKLNTVLGNSEIGRYNFIALDYFSGYIADVQVYNSSLTPSQVQTLYREGVSGTPLGIPSVVSWWPLDGDANDYSRNNNGTAYNLLYAQQSVPAASLQGSQNVYGASFNGQDSYITLNDPQLNTAQNSYDTFAFWMYWTGKANEAPIGFGQKYGLYLASNCLGFSTFNNDVYGVGTAGLANRWIFITASFYNGAYTGKDSLYINGVQQQLRQCSGSAGSGTLTTNFQMGANGNSNSIFNGTIAGVEAYNTQLTGSQAYQLYANQPNPASSIVIPMGWIP